MTRPSANQSGSGYRAGDTNRLENRQMTINQTLLYYIMNIKKLLILLLLLGSSSPAFCCGDTLRCRFYFPVGSSTPDLSYRNNGVRLDSLLSGIRSRQSHSVLRRISMRSGSSPEGNSASNKRLSDERLASLRGLILERLSVPDSVFVCTSSGNDWEGLASLVKASDMPYREEVLRILRDTPEWVTRNGVVVDSRKRQLMNLRGGRVWHYMAEHFFPELRHSSVIECEFEPVPKGPDRDTAVLPRQAKPRDTVIVRDTIERTVVIRDTVQAAVPVADVPKAFYMGLKTNLLYDALLVPNIGVELYLGKGWAVGGNWMYAWWNSNKRHNYWRLYGGELDVRKYFGRRVADKPLTGHHLGLYGQLFTYDFETGGKGYMGGKPGGSLWEKCNYAVGVEYGYSLPVGRRLNLDFVIGAGYWGGEYHTYVPDGGRYVWRETRRRHWFGPTKAEVSLVWLLGRGNYNDKKGGGQ